jgi:hypothetical protein
MDSEASSYALMSVRKHRLRHNLLLQFQYKDGMKLGGMPDSISFQADTTTAEQEECERAVVKGEGTRLCLYLPRAACGAAQHAPHADFIARPN